MIKLDLVQLLLTASMRLTPACFSLVSLALSSASLLAYVSRGTSRSLPKDSGVPLLGATSPLFRLMLNLIVARRLLFHDEVCFAEKMREKISGPAMPTLSDQSNSPNGWLVVCAITRGSLATRRQVGANHSWKHILSNVPRMNVCSDARARAIGHAAPMCWSWRPPLSCEW
jgi:hypothetical protein